MSDSAPALDDAQKSENAPETKPAVKLGKKDEVEKPDRPTAERRYVAKSVNAFVQWMPLGGSGAAFASFCLPQNWAQAVMMFNQIWRETPRRTNLSATEEAELRALGDSVRSAKYRQLEELLQAKQWRDADQETYRLMITTVGKEEGQWFEPEDLSNFPCEDLRALDGLWVRYSPNGKWGFSVQKRIWQECGSPGPYDKKTEAQWEQFGDRVGWRKDGNWLQYENFALRSTGELPCCCGWVSVFWPGSLFSSGSRPDL
jgi:hypothetical protein